MNNKLFKLVGLGVVIILFSFGACYFYTHQDFEKPFLPILISSPIPTSIPDQIYSFPIGNYSKNQTKKVFGQYITKENSPVQPERFEGCHTGVDVEINSDQLDKEVLVYAIANAELIYKKSVSGYGGVAILKFQIDKEDYTALYGHLDLKSIEQDVGAEIKKGDKIGVLGKENSVETDRERKHLHFAVQKGISIELRGYVQNESELSAWINPNSLYD